MKFIKYLVAAASFFALTACMGGGDVKSSVNDDTRILVSATVGSDGKLNFAGSGAFAGFSVSAVSQELAGKTVQIEKSEAAYSVDGYISLSSVYTITVSGVSETVLANVTVPYNPNLLASEGGSAADAVFCTISGGNVTKYTTAAGSGSDVSAPAALKSSFFAGYKKSAASTPLTGIIRLGAVSYASASVFFTDPSGKQLPDVSRGISHVQPGEKVVLNIDEVTFGEVVTSHTWTLTVRPSGSASSLTFSGDSASFIPDTAGKYTVSLVLNGVNGKILTETKDIYALNYTADQGGGASMCYVSCHSGAYASSGQTDKYGRQILRDMITPWSATAHASAYASVAGQTDSKCYQCHTTGFIFTDRNSNNADDYPSAAGYDNTVTNWAAMTSSATHVRNVTCEACHGPNDGSSAGFFEKHYKNTPVTSNVCLTCHDYGNVGGHVFKYSSGHDNSHKLASGNVARNAACFKCHTGEGMMGRIFNKDINPSNTESVSGIGCSVCHDPHGEGGLDAQLRIAGNYTLPTGSTTVNAGNSRLCYNCHNAEISLPAVGTIPHNSQAEMIQGIGGYTYGASLGTTKSIHGLMNAGCSTCHMRTQGGATHELDMHDNPTARIAGCVASCHTNSTPVYSGGHYDLSGAVAAAISKIDQLKSAINAKAGLPAETSVKAVYTGTTPAQTDALNRAAYNYNFIMSDRSGGFHNPGYIVKLVDLSLTNLAAN